MKRILLAITGASGAIYGIRLLQALRASGLAEVHLILSEAACWTVPHETGLSAAEVETFADHSSRWNEIWQLPASGSYPMDSMVIAPCSMKTLAAIRIGLGDTLITRSADVAIKEHRQLILCPRETPLSAIHLDNMAYLAHLGVCILPPMPGFYHKPQTIEDLICHHTMKVFDQLQLPFPQAHRWNPGE